MIVDYYHALIARHGLDKDKVPNSVTRTASAWSNYDTAKAFYGERFIGLESEPAFSTEVDGV